MAQFGALWRKMGMTLPTKRKSFGTWEIRRI